jgi:hypothetical protein
MKYAYYFVVKLKFVISLIMLSLLIHIPVYSQFSEEKIETDSSNISIIRNSLYRVFDEEYKYKDLIWRNVRYINDTTKLLHEGWATKNWRYIGIWNEYLIDGTPVFTVDYDKGTWFVNEKLFPYHDILVKMKLIADSLIVAVYGQDFYNNHIHFAFKCGAYDDAGYVGNWLEPLERKPNEYSFRYDIKLDSIEYYQNMVGISLDENGNYIVEDDIYSNFGFEKVQSSNKVFRINKKLAIDKSIENGLNLTDSSEVSGFLRWEKNRSKTFYSGSFKFYVTELYEIIKDVKENERSRITYRFYVYSFDPWTGDFLEKKKMKKIAEWEKYSGSTSGLLPDE